MGKRGPLPKNNLPTAPVDVAVKPNSKLAKEAEARERRWRAEDALRTCQQYEKNKQDKQLMADVKQLAKQQMNDLKKIV